MHHTIPCLDKETTTRWRSTAANYILVALLTILKTKHLLGRERCALSGLLPSKGPHSLTEPTPAAAPEENLFAGIGENAPPSSSAPATTSVQEPNLFEGIGRARRSAITGSARREPVAGVGEPAAQQSQPTEAANTDFLDTAQPASPLDTAKALALGAAKGAFATKDFFVNGAGLWGSSPQEEDRSWMRQSIDQASADMQRKWGAGYSFAEGVGQVAVGLLGAGKITAALKLGTAVTSAAETMAGVASFEPHAANFANLASNVPFLSGPLTQALASKPSDSDAMGYVKNALTSLGVSAATVATFVGSAALLRAMNSGDRVAIDAASKDLETALDAHQAEQDKWATPSASDQTTSHGEVPSSASPSSSGSLSPSASSSPPFDGPQAQEASPTSSPSLTSPASNLGEPPQALTPSSSEPSPSISTASSASQSGQQAAKGFALSDEQFDRFLATSKADQAAFLKWGSWEGAQANGHVFGQEDHIPWHLIAGTNEGAPATALDAFIARTAAAFKDQADTLKGGAVQSDAATAQAVQARAELWGQDQGALLGMLQQAGEAAPTLRADMQAGFTVAQRILQDCWTLASRIDMGDFSEFGGSKAAAQAALQQRVQIGAQAFSAANSILANAARTVRGAAGQFRIDPATLGKMAGLDPDALVTLLKSTGGDPRSLAKAIQPTIWQRAAEGAQLFLVNNLVSNPLTHFVIGARTRGRCSQGLWRGWRGLRSPAPMTPWEPQRRSPTAIWPQASPTLPLSDAGLQDRRQHHRAT